MPISLSLMIAGRSHEPKQISVVLAFAGARADDVETLTLESPVY